MSDILKDLYFMDLTFDFYGIDNQCFNLNGITFEALEDPDDGYRSYLDSIVLNNNNNCVFFKNPIAKIKLVQAPVDNSENPAPGWKLIDIDDNHVWLEIGTDYSDDYYPFFVFRYNPKISL